jgi:F-type H+-transporting ATPase subunit b
MLNFSVTFFITLVNLGVLFVIMRAVLFKPVTKFMESRAAKVQGDIDNAAKQVSDANALKADYEKKIAAVADECAALKAAARADGQKEADALIAAAKAEAQGIRAQAEKESEREKEAAWALFQTEAAALVVAAARQLLRRELSAEAPAEAEAFLKELAATKAFRGAAGPFNG